MKYFEQISSREFLERYSPLSSTEIDKIEALANEFNTSLQEIFDNAVKEKNRLEQSSNAKIYSDTILDFMMANIEAINLEINSLIDNDYIYNLTEEVTEILHNLYYEPIE